jgi:hypothetical protein
MNYSNLALMILLVSGCNFQGASKLTSSSTVKLDMLSNMSDTKKISLAGELMIDSLKDDLLSGGFSLTEVKAIVQSAKVEVSLAASLTIESSSLTLAASSANPYAVATSAVTKGALASPSSDGFESDSLSFSLNASSQNADRAMKKLKAISGGTMKALGRVKTEMAASNDELIEATSEVSAQAASSISKSGIPADRIMEAAGVIASATIENITESGITGSSSEVIKSLTKGTLTGISQLFATSATAETAGDVSKTFINVISESSLATSSELNDLIGAVAEGAVSSLNEMTEVKATDMSAILSEIQSSSFEAIMENFSGTQAADMFVSVAAGSVEGLADVQMMNTETTILSTIYQDTVATTSSTITSGLGMDGSTYTAAIEKSVEEAGSKAVLEAMNDPCINNPSNAACMLMTCDAMVYTNSYGVKSPVINLYGDVNQVPDNFGKSVISTSCRVPAALNSCPAAWAPGDGSSLSWNQKTDLVTYCEPSFIEGPNKGGRGVDFDLYGNDPSSYPARVGESIFVNINVYDSDPSVQTRASFIRGCSEPRTELVIKDWNATREISRQMTIDDYGVCLKLQISVKNSDSVDEAGSPEKGDRYRVYPIYVYTNSEPYYYSNYINLTTGWINYSQYNNNYPPPMNYNYDERIVEAQSMPSLEVTSSMLNTSYRFEITQDCGDAPTILLSSGNWIPAVETEPGMYKSTWIPTIPSPTDSRCPTYVVSYLKNNDSITRDEIGAGLRTRRMITIVQPTKIPPRLSSVTIGAPPVNYNQSSNNLLKVGTAAQIVATAGDILQAGTAPVSSNLSYKFVKENRCGTQSTVVLRDWNTSNILNYTPTSADVMTKNGTSYNSCVFIAAYVRDADGVDYYGPEHGDHQNGLYIFVSDVSVSVTSPAASGIDQLSGLKTGDSITLDLSYLKAAYPDMTQIKIGYNCNNNYYYGNGSVLNNNYMQGSLTNEFIAFSNNFTFTIPSYLMSCETGVERSLSLQVLLRNGDSQYTFGMGTYDGYDIQVPVPGTLKFKALANINFNVSLTSGMNPPWDNYGPIFKVGDHLNISSYLNGGYMGVGMHSYRFELIHDNCLGSTTSELISDWSSMSMINDYVLQSSSPCSSLLVSIRDESGDNLTGIANRGDGYAMGHLNTLPAGQMHQSYISNSQVTMVQGFKGQYNNIIAYPGENLQFTVNAQIYNGSGQVPANMVRAALYRGCNYQYGINNGGVGVMVPGTDTGWVAANSTLSIPISLSLPANNMNSCLQLGISSKDNDGIAFDLLQGDGLWTAPLEVTPLAQVRPTIFANVTAGGVQITDQPHSKSLSYTDTLNVSLIGADPDPNQNLMYRLELRNSCTNTSIYSSTWSNTTTFSFVPGTNFDPATLQSTAQGGYSYVNKCLTLQAYVKDDDGIDTNGPDVGDSGFWLTMGVSDGRLPIIMLSYGEKRFDGSIATPMNVVTGTYHNVSFNNYIDGEGLPLLTKMQMIETCDGVYQTTRYPVLRQSGSNLAVDGNGYALAPMNYVEFQIPTPSACGGVREMSINLLLKDQNPTNDVTYSQHDLNLSFGNTAWLD